MQRTLVERAQRGDREAFTDLAAASLARLDAVARLILRDPDLAKDAVQNGLVRAWRDLPTLRDPDRFDAWIRRLVVRACLDELRVQRRRSVSATVMDIGHPVEADASSAVPKTEPSDMLMTSMPFSTAQSMAGTTTSVEPPQPKTRSA